MFQRLTLKKPKLSADEMASAVFNKLFKEEINRTYMRMRVYLTDSEQIAGKNRFDLAIISLFVFIVEYSTYAVFGNSSTKNKILKSFHTLIKNEFNGSNEFIIELARKFESAYKENPEEPVIGLGICFSGCINKKNKCDILSGMAASTETAKKFKLITNYYHQINQEYKIN